MRRTNGMSGDGERQSTIVSVNCHSYRRVTKPSRRRGKHDGAVGDPIERVTFKLSLWT
jgi:hypothetical protein